MEKIGARVVFKNTVNLLDCDWWDDLFTFAGLNLSDPKNVLFYHYGICYTGSCLSFGI